MIGSARSDTSPSCQTKSPILSSSCLSTSISRISAPLGAVSAIPALAVGALISPTSTTGDYRIRADSPRTSVQDVQAQPVGKMSSSSATTRSRLHSDSAHPIWLRCISCARNIEPGQSGAKHGQFLYCDEQRSHTSSIGTLAGQDEYGPFFAPSSSIAKQTRYTQRITGRKICF